MGFVPRNRSEQAMLRRQLGQDLPIVVYRWGPVPLKPVAVLARHSAHEVHCEPVLMRTLPRAHFRGAFGEQVSLPVGTAETLERFHQELRNVGLVRKGEVLRQSAKLKTHFRVQVADIKLSASDIHSHSSILENSGFAETGGGERAPKLRRSEPKPVSNVLRTLELDLQVPVHDRRPKGGRNAPT